MKRVRCPKCDNYIQFDETQYEEGQSLVFVCGQCKKQFGIRIGKSKLNAANRRQEQAALDEQEGTKEFGNVIVIENVFAFKQVLPLKEGDNLIGRRNQGTDADVPVETNDPSMDRRHCILNVKRGRDGRLTYTLRDNNSLTGTFVHNELLGPKERLRIEDGTVFTLGATTLILRAAQPTTTEDSTI